MIIKADVEHIASLACIELNEEDVQAFTVQFNSILEYFEELDEIETELTVEDDEFNVLRADEVTPSLTQEEALSNASRTDSGYFKGPRIL
jgi:aspartyl-tRNA(Asn)/glutamyl-tRNA(Gln) amidotransferase subunit C